jgi:hypothetical protein
VGDLNGPLWIVGDLNGLLGITGVSFPHHRQRTRR